MISFFGWLAGTKAGRITLAVGAALAAFFIAILKAFSAGQAAEKEKQNKQTIKAYQTRERVNDDVKKMEPADLDGEYARWMRPTSKE